MKIENVLKPLYIGMNVLIGVLYGYYTINTADQFFMLSLLPMLFPNYNVLSIIVLQFVTLYRWLTTYDILYTYTMLTLLDSCTAVCIAACAILFNNGYIFASIISCAISLVVQFGITTYLYTWNLIYLVLISCSHIYSAIVGINPIGGSVPKVLLCLASQWSMIYGIVDDLPFDELKNIWLLVTACALIGCNILIYHYTVYKYKTGLDQDQVIIL